MDDNRSGENERMLHSYAITCDILAITTNPDCVSEEGTDHQVRDHTADGRTSEMMSDTGGHEQS